MASDAEADQLGAKMGEKVTILKEQEGEDKAPRVTLVSLCIYFLFSPKSLGGWPLLCSAGLISFSFVLDIFSRKLGGLGGCRDHSEVGFAKISVLRVAEKLAAVGETYVERLKKAPGHSSCKQLESLCMSLL